MLFNSVGWSETRILDVCRETRFAPMAIEQRGEVSTLVIVQRDEYLRAQAHNNIHIIIVAVHCVILLAIQVSAPRVAIELRRRTRMGSAAHKILP